MLEYVGLLDERIFEKISILVHLLQSFCFDMIYYLKATFHATGVLAN